MARKAVKKVVDWLGVTTSMSADLEGEEAFSGHASDPFQTSSQSLLTLTSAQNS